MVMNMMDDIKSHVKDYEDEEEIASYLSKILKKEDVYKRQAYLKAKERYDTQREKMAGRYKAKTAMYEALMLLLIWYSASTTLFQMIQSKVCLLYTSRCV